MQSEIEDNIRKKFKYYKLNTSKLCLNDVIIPDSRCLNKVTAVTKQNGVTDERVEYLGLQKFEKWNTFSFNAHPGLLLITNPFTSLGQRYWIRKCLEEYPKKPNKINMDIETHINDWWAECYKDGQCNRHILKKLRWTTLGYHHNWDTKIYEEENRTPFPQDLSELVDVVANYLGYKDFKAEAAIINYYHMNSTLSAHTDHSEVNLEAPLFSFSFGQSAIFLIGGQDKSTEPSAILLKSGDIMIMSKESRLCYHAVPKILPAHTESWNNNSDDKIPMNNVVNFKFIRSKESLIHDINRNSDNCKWKTFDDYIKESRINMNVRQVLQNNQSCLPSNNVDIT